jgi:hypothetical protein
VGAQGTATLDFGAFPGSTDTKVNVAGQTGLVGPPTQLIEAWLIPLATTDHSADEHTVAPMKVRAVFVGTAPTPNFDIYGIVEDNPGGGSPTADGMRLYGLWSVGWVWNGP